MLDTNYPQLLTLSIITLTGLTFSTPKAEAAILWDYSPETTGTTSGASLLNLSISQNFVEILSFADAVELTGMDIYSRTAVGSVGDSVMIRIWTDNAGTPDTLIHDFTDTISVIDTEGVGSWSAVNRKFADFSDSPISLDANTSYWIGMSGTTTNISQNLLDTNPGDGQVGVFSGTSFQSLNTSGDMAFRLQGEVQTAQTTPEPGSRVGLLALGILGGFSLIKAKKG